MARSGSAKVMPLYRRLEYSSVGVALGSVILLITGTSTHSADTQSAGISGLGTSVICFVVLRVANRGRDSQHE